MKRISSGALAMIGAAFFFSVMSALVKVAGARLPVPEIVASRAVVTLVLSIATVIAKGLSPWGNRKGLLVLRGLFGSGGLFCYFFAVDGLPLADATTLHFINPVLSTIGAAIFLRERLTIGDAIGTVLCIGGVILIARPSMLFGGVQSLEPIFVGAALLGAVFASGAYVTVRSARGSDDPVIVVLYFSLIALPIAIPFAWREWIWPTPLEWLTLLGVGIVTQLGQVLMTMALYRESTARATTVSTIQVLFAFGWGLALFGESLSWWSAAGALAMTIGVVIAARSHRAPVQVK